MSYVDLNTVWVAAPGEAMPAAWPSTARNDIHLVASPPACSMRLTLPVPVSNDATLVGVPIPFPSTHATEEYNLFGMHSLFADDSRITAVTDGIYLINGQTAFAPNAIGVRTLYLKMNGSVYLTNDTRVNVGGTFYTTISTSRYVEMVAGDYIEMHGAQNSGGILNVAEEFTFLQAHWVSANV